MSTVEPQYSHCVEVDKVFGRTRFGLMSNQVWHDDPKRLLFVLARYKFVSRMMAGKNRVLEVGCADAFGTRLVRQTVPNVTATDIDPLFIEDCLSREGDSAWPVTYKVHDMVAGAFGERFDGVYALDVFEHIPANVEHQFIRNAKESLADDGILIIGSPSLESQQYASEGSKEGHVNCKSGDDMRQTFRKHFDNVLLFSMNDEIVHTGFEKMAHYLFAVCIGKKS
jgi:2-polyprenyl-3-methyl-5-hydroxy-6-metoxy-1,4-benzoquinol methylase